MSKTKALKYLILDTINKYKNSNNSELINKIQNSLNVEDLSFKKMILNFMKETT